MTYLPTTKWGDCTECPSKYVACVKAGKNLVCVPCNNKNKAAIQMDKVKKRNASRNTASKLRNVIANTDYNREAAKQENTLDNWFKDRRKEMKGKCEHCGGISCKSDDKYYKHSIAHILPKKIFKSVATHPDNWIELCFWNKSCHTNFDNHMIDLIDLNCFDTVIEKFVRIYPAIAAEEKRYIPKILIEYFKTETI